LDIDSGHLDLPEDLPAFPKSQELIDKIKKLTEFFKSESSISNNDIKIHDFYLKVFFYKILG